MKVHQFGNNVVIEPDAVATHIVTITYLRSEPRASQMVLCLKDVPGSGVGLAGILRAVADSVERAG